MKWHKSAAKDALQPQSEIKPQKNWTGSHENNTGAQIKIQRDKYVE